MDFVFDRTADDRVLKDLVIVDDATHELVAIEVERAISGHGVARILDRLARSSAACRRSSAPTTARSSVARRCSSGHMPVASPARSEGHTSELQSLMRTSYAVFCL